MLRRMLNNRIVTSSAKPEPDWLKGFLVGSGTIAAWRRAESHSLPVHGHWELRNRIFPPLQKKNYREGRELAAIYRIASKTNKSHEL